MHLYSFLGETGGGHFACPLCIEPGCVPAGVCVGLSHGPLRGPDVLPDKDTGGEIVSDEGCLDLASEHSSVSSPNQYTATRKKRHVEETNK